MRSRIPKHIIHNKPVLLFLSDSQKIHHCLLHICSVAHGLVHTGAVRISSMALGTAVPEIRDSSSAGSKSPSASYFSSMASITLLVNLYGLAVDAMTVFV